jgi:single-strand DNA-binding protein
MAASINKVLLIGLVTKDPEIRSMSNNGEVATFFLATSKSWKDKQTGERKEKAEFHRIVVYSSGLVGIIKQYVKKGTKLYIEGSLQTRKWTDNQGIEKYSTEIVLQGFNSILQILNKKKESKSIVESVKEDYPDAKEVPFAEEEDEVLDDEIPF